MAMIIALGTTVNVFAQERNLKIYFNEHSDTATGPRIYVTDDNSEYGIPLGTKVSAEGLTWATGARWFSFLQQNVTDRVLADYEDESGMASHLKISFMDEEGESTFPYEVNNIQWNIMNDLFSGTILGDAFDNLQMNTICTPAEGKASLHTEEHWELNPFARNASFTKSEFPSSEGLVLKGLKSFEFGEKNFFKIKGWIPFVGEVTLYSRQTELNDRCREFIKARWNGSNTNPKVKDDDGNLINIEEDDNCWAFKVTFTLPDIRMRSYSWRFANNVGTLGELDNNIIKGESGKHALRGYITAHAGNVVPIEAPADPDDNIPEAFHYEYFAKDPNQITIIRTTGVITNAKVAGDIPVIVKLMRGNREVCSYEQTIHVYAVDPNRPEIAIGFLNGNKGYDVTVGDENAQIQGFITKYGENITLSNGTSGYHFEYSEDSNGEIIDIDPLTGKITAKKEGNVHVSAVLKNGGTISSNTYTYSLHVFAKHEGLEFRRINTYHYTTATNRENWKVSSYNNTTTTSNDWKSNDLLKVNTSISGRYITDENNWKQIASFSTNSSNNWRAICQEIAFDLYVPKYTKASATYSFGGNVAIGTSNKGTCNYGLEFYYLNQGSQITESEAYSRFVNRNWNTVAITDIAGTILRNGTKTYVSNIGDGDTYERGTNNVDAEDSYNHKTYTVYFAAMAYLWKDHSYPGNVSIGFKGIPTYEYYSTITYYNNDGTEDVWYKTDKPLTTTDKTESFKMPNTIKNLPERAGYEFIGWSTDPNATTAEYPGKDGDFYPYDDVNGGGKGPVSLYAVWRLNTYTVTLDPQGGTGGSTSVTAAYGLPLPSGLTAPTKEGYEFKGYYSNANNDYYESIGQDSGGKQYYDKDMVGVADWDYTYSGVTLYAHWAPATFIVTFNGTNGAIVPKQLQYDSQSAISDVIYNSDGVVKISFKYGGQCPSKITNGKFKKAGFKLVGFYDSNNMLVATVDVDHPEDRNIYFNESSGYWTRKNGIFVWNCTHDVNLTARYEPKYTVRDGDIIDFGTEYLEVGIDWENSMVHDLLGAALAEKEAGRISSTNPVMVFDIRNAKYLDNSSKKSDDLMVPLRDKDFISPNLLVYLGEGAYNVIENEIKTDGKCPGLVVTDRFPIKIPYAFNASKASYARDAQVNDAATEQASKSTWGTLCLPYPIKNNNTYKDVSKVIFYELRKHSGSVMQFYKLPEDAVIPANTPVLYERTVGISSAVTIEEISKNIYEPSIYVPDNPNFTAVVKSYADAPEPSIHDWEFRGNLKTTVFCGKGYVNPPAGAQILDGDVYYFKQDKFTYLNPKMEKNGKTYQAAKMTLYPYRAYFYRNTEGSYYSSAKVSEYSILVIGEDGATLDITNEIFGDGEGDGKIYDLNGIRVMKPVKGRLYIVNGQKKVYK